MTFRLSPSLLRPALRPFRRFVRGTAAGLRHDLPTLFSRGGAVHVREQAPVPAERLRPALRAILHASLRRWQAWGVLRLSGRIVGNDVELRLEPRSVVGHIFLKLFDGQAASYLQRLHRRLFEQVHGRPSPTFQPSGLLLSLLCRQSYIYRLRLSTVFFISLPRPKTLLPPFHSEDETWLVSANLFGITRRGPIRLPWFRSILWQLHPVAVIHTETGQHLHGFTVHEPSGFRRRQERQAMHLHHRQGMLRLQPGPYGGFDQRFPFKQTERPTHLFYEKADGSIDVYEMICEYPANHLQRFSVQSLLYRESQRPTFLESAKQTQRPLPAKAALYLSRIDLHVRRTFSLRRNDLLWRNPPLGTVVPPVWLNEEARRIHPASPGTDVSQLP